MNLRATFCVPPATLKCFCFASAQNADDLIGIWATCTYKLANGKKHQQNIDGHIAMMAASPHETIPGAMDFVLVRSEFC